jgi:hypothetical protein
MTRKPFIDGSLNTGARRTLCAMTVGLALSSAGCFRMVSVDPSAAPVDEDLRVNLTPAAAGRVAREFGVAGTRLVGRIAPAGQDSLALDTWLGQIYTDATLANSRLVIPLHRSEILEVQRRELSVRKTVLATAAGAGFIALLLSRTTLFEADAGDDDNGGPPPPPDEGFAQRALRFSVSVPLRFGR